MIDRRPDQVTYYGEDQPDVEVRVDGEWFEGELRNWVKVDDVWRASVQWRRGPGEGTYFQDFAEDDVRLDTRPVRPAP